MKVNGHYGERTRFAAISFAVLSFVISGTLPAAEMKLAPKYEKMLYELGAFPVAKLSKPYFTNGHPGQVYSKGEREDAAGWLPPGIVGEYLTDAEKLKYGIPKAALRYEQYMAMLDIEEYKRTHDAGLFLVMEFALGCMVENRVQVRKADILRLYEARVGLEGATTSLLRGRLSGEDVVRLLKSDVDVDLFSILPPPVPADRAYVDFLVQQSHSEKWPLHRRLAVFQLLFAMDGKSYREPFRKFLLKNAPTAGDWWERWRLYDGLIQLHDAESMAAVSTALTHDPGTDCRELILSSLEEHGDATSALDALLTIANGLDKPHRALATNRSSRQWWSSLNGYLKWAKEQKGLDAHALGKIAEATQKLKAAEDWRDDLKH